MTEPATTQEEWPTDPISLTTDNFDRVIGTYPAVFVYMWAEACDPCKETKERLDELAERFQNRVRIGTLCTDDQRALAKRNRSWRGRLVGKLTAEIDGPLPGLILYVDGEVTARDAYVDADYDDRIAYLADWIEQNLPDGD